MPARSPYDRQLLREHVELLAGRLRTVQLGLDGTRWTVTRVEGQSPSCATCAEPRGVLRCSRADDHEPTCIACVMRPGIVRRVDA
jgi:hypothetical protein